MRTLLAIALALAAGRAHADAPMPVTLHDAVAAVTRAPTAQIGGHEIAEAEANIGAAGAWPSPSVHVATNRLTARLQAGATLPVAVFGTVGAAVRHAEAEADVVRADVELAQRELRHRVVAAWVAIARSDADVVALAIAAQQAAELEVIAKGRLASGVGSDVDVTIATASRARADVAVAAAQREVDAASARLAGLLGWDPARRLHAEGALAVGSPAQLGALQLRLGKHPERAAALRRIAAAEAGLDQVLAQRWPSLAVEAEVSVDDPTNEHHTDVMVGLALELPIFARVGDRARAARAAEAVERARLAVTEAELRAGLVAAYRMWQAASERLAALEHDVVPAQERAAALSAQAYREGARPLASALQAERDLAAVRAELNESRADAAQAFADLQLAIGDEVGDAK